MKITIRPLQRGKVAFTVEIETSETIAHLKLRISTEQGYPVEAQNILLSGKSLQDDRTIDSYNIKSTSPLVLLPRAGSTTASASINGASATNSSQTAPALPISTPPPAPTPPPPAPAPALAPPAPIPASAQPFALGQPPTQAHSLNGTGIPSNMGASRANIEQIMAMGLGFPEDQVTRALRASFDNPNEAVEYLFSGIPAHLESGPAAVAAPAAPQPPPNFLANLLQSTSNGAAAPNSGFPQSLVQLLQQQQQRQQQQEQPPRGPSSMPFGGPGGLGGLGGLGGMGGLSGMGSLNGMGGLGSAGGMGGSGGMAGMGGMAGSGGEGEPGDAVEIDPAKVEEIRRLVANNPALTRPLVAHIKEQEPELAAGLTEDPESVLRFFSQGADDSGRSGGGSVPLSTTAPALAAPPSRPSLSPSPSPAPALPANQRPGLTLADEASINRLQEMGYKREIVLEAFISCGRNEHAAANFLAEGVFD